MNTINAIAQILSVSENQIVSTTELSHVYSVVFRNFNGIKCCTFVGKRKIKYVPAKVGGLTEGVFSEACGYRVRPQHVTPKMLALAKQILKVEAVRVANTPSCNWWSEPLIAKIEEELSWPSDRVIQSVLLVAAEYGEIDLGVRVHAY